MDSYPVNKCMLLSRMAGLMQNQWQHGICGCLSDPGLCCKGYFCALCMACDNAEKVGKGGMLWCCLTCLMPTCVISLTRTATREKYGIEGSPMMDWVFGCCLSACTNCNTAMEFKARDELGM